MPARDGATNSGAVMRQMGGASVGRSRPGFRGFALPSAEPAHVRAEAAPSPLRSIVRLVGGAVALALIMPGLAVAMTLLSGRSLGLDQSGLYLSTAYSALFYAALLAAIGSVRSRLLHHVAYDGLVLYTLLFTFAYVFHFLVYQQLLGDPAIAAIVDSSPLETKEFLGWVFDGRKVLIACACALGAALVAMLARPRLPGRRGSRLLPWGLVLMLLPFGIQKREVAQYNPFFFLTRSTAYALMNRHAVAEAQAMRGSIVFGEASAPETEAVHVLVIGEATTRRHMSLYGYERPTTPGLSALGSSVLVARNACSSRGATAPALQEMLTFATRDDHAPLYDKPSLLQVLRKAGFAATWLSNQQFSGKFDNWSAILSEPAGTRVFTNRVGWADGSSYDGQLLAPLDRALAAPDKRKFIVIHLLGAHADYGLRYPGAFSAFDAAPAPAGLEHVLPANLVKMNAYDNAVRYTDHIVSQIVARTRAASPNASVTFLSDHGEGLGESGDFMGHIDGQTPRQIYEIPLLFWLSDALREQLGPKLADFSGNAEKPFQADAMIHTLLDLYGVRYADRMPERSLFSAAYTPTPRYCDTLQP